MTHSKHQPRGVAMVIVLAVVAVATVLSFGLIGSQSILAQASGNGSRAMQADALAESGLQLAAYYLQNPDKAPTLNADGYWPGQSNVSFGDDIEGTVDITVTKPTGDAYYIHSRSTGTTGLHRAVAAKATIGYAYVPVDAMTVNGNLNVYSNMDVTGSVRANGSVNVSAGGKVTGTIYAQSILGSLLNVVGTILTPSSGSSSNPSPTSVKTYSTYTYKGKTYSATTISGNISGTLGPTATNPLGVYRATSDISVTGPLTVKGSLIVASGKLNVKSDLTVNATKDMPGLVVENDVLMHGNSRKVNVLGLTWIGGKLAKGSLISTNNQINIVGATQFGSSGAIDSSYSGTFKSTYSKGNAGAVDFAAGLNKTPTSVRLISFSPSAGDE